MNVKKQIATKFVAVNFLLALLAPITVLACGVSMISTGAGWTYGNDAAEQSFINYENGQEKLVISRSFENGSHDTVWVIPIPASPNSIKVDVLADTPRFSGYDVSQEAYEHLGNIRDGLLATQIYTVPFIVKFMGIGSNTLGTKSAGTQTLGLDAPRSMTSSVTVYQHLEKQGMVAEVLSATNSNDIYQYFKDKGLKIPQGSVSVLQDYIGKDFAFVASWISPSATGKATKGLLMDFPSKNIFYPLHPGSVYPGNGLPETITVVGHVSPKLYADIKDQTAVDYFYSPLGSSLNGFFTTDAGFGFTKIVVNVKPPKLTQDLYISPSTPARIMNAQLINLHPFVYGLMLLIILSFLATYLTVRLIFVSAENRPSWLSLGLVNCLTIMGTVVGSRVFLKVKRLKFVIFFSLIFVALTIITLYLLSLAYK